MVFRQLVFLISKYSALWKRCIHYAFSIKLTGATYGNLISSDVKWSGTLAVTTVAAGVSKGLHAESESS